MTEQKTIAWRKARQAMAEQALSREQLLISKYLSSLSFRPRLWGVDEKQVWDALEKLAALYEDALTLERSRRELAQRQLEAIKSRQEAENEDITPG